MTKVPEKAQTLTEEIEKEHAVARAFILKYGCDYADEANEICRDLVIEMMRNYQAHIFKNTMRSRDLVKYLEQKKITFRDLKIACFKKLFRQLARLSKSHGVPCLAPRDFIKKCELGESASEDEMEKFWDDLWQSLPEPWQSEDFRWHHIYFSEAELPFFVWICRPIPRTRGSFVVRTPKEQKHALNGAEISSPN